MDIKEQLDEERIMQGMTIRELGRKSGLADHTAWQFLRRQGGNLYTAECMAEALGCELTLKKK